MFDIGPLVVLHAKLQRVKKKYPTQQFHHSSEEVLQEKICTM